MPDYYQILGVSREASAESIRKAYRVKAKLFHPDLYKGSDAKKLFQQINEAYHILIDSEKRRIYDNRQKLNTELYRRYGKNWESRNQTAAQSQSQHADDRHSYSYYHSYTGRQENIYQKRKLKKLNLFTDNILFATMLIIGFIAIILGVNDLFFTKWEGSKNLSGILFGLSYTILLLYGWHLRRSKNNK